MKKRKTIFCFLFFTFSFLFSPFDDLNAYPPAMRATTEKGRLVGRISNRSQGGILIPNLEVFLEKYVNQNLTEKVRTLTDRDGYFQFVDLLLTPENSYRVALKYQGVDYSGHPFSFAQGENLKTMEIGVYDATDKPEKIKINMKHIFIDIEEGVLKVTEALSIENFGNTTYRGPLHFSLLKGFENLQFGRGIDTCCSEIKESGFSENVPFYPGRKEVTYSYQLKYDSPRYLFTPIIDYLTENLDLMIRDLGIKLESKRLVFISAVEMGEKKYLRLSARELLPNENVEVKISGLPLGPERYRLYVLIFAGLIVLFGLAYPFIRRKPVTIGESGEVGQMGEKEELLKEIAELDDRYAAGEIGTEEYEKLRRKKKKILVKRLASEKSFHL